MDNDIKRRFFLTGIVGALVGLPLGVRLLSGKRDHQSSHRFSTMLKKYTSLTDCDITTSQGPSTFTLPLKTSPGDEWRYVFFSPTFFPNEISVATINEPDVFYVRDGALLFGRTTKGQTVITGGDVFSGMVTPVGDDEKEKKAVTILVKDTQLSSAKPKGTSAPSHQDIHLAHLLSLNLPKTGELKPGMKWTGQTGRIKPFTGFVTQYEIVGYADLSGRRTVEIRFQGKIPNIIGLEKGNADKSIAVSGNKHEGRCFFDLETGMLVRQEMEMELFNGGLQGYKPLDGSDALTFRSKLILQILPT